MTFFDALKNIFLLLVFLQLAPALVHGIKKQYLHYLEPRTQVAVVTFNSFINDANCYIKQLNTYFKDESIKAILFKVDCPGSTSGSGQSIYNEIMALKKEYPKPIITLTENVCASGAYWIACASDYIIAPGCALIGSIGVTLPFNFKLNEFLEQYHIKYKQLKAGAYKNALDPFAQTTPEEYALLQSTLDDTYQQFVQAVAASRKLSATNANVWADGKIFTGQQALKVGLIDELGSMHTAVRALKEKALIEGEIEWVKESPDKGMLAKLFGMPSCTTLINQLVTSARTGFVTA